MSRLRLLSVIISVTFLAVFLLPASQQAYTQAVLPDDIQFVDGPDVLLAGGNNYTIDLQLTLKGANYSGNNFGIYFQSSNPLLVDILPARRSYRGPMVGHRITSRRDRVLVT